MYFSLYSVINTEVHDYTKFIYDRFHSTLAHVLVEYAANTHYWAGALQACVWASIRSKPTLYDTLVELIWQTTLQTFSKSDLQAFNFY